MNNPDTARRLVLWAIELCEFDILHQPRIAVKAQALANFVVEFTSKEDEDEELATRMVQTDGSSNQHVGGIGVIFQSPKGDSIECAVHLQFLTTNNEAEYEVVLTGLNLAKVVGASLVVIHSDSEFIFGHINGDYEAKGE